MLIERLHALALQGKALTSAQVDNLHIKLLKVAAVITRNTRRIRLRREPWQTPQGFGFGEDTLVPMCAGETIAWRVSAAEA